MLDSLLIVQDSDGQERSFHVFNKVTGHHVADFGLRGRGPGETLNLSSANMLQDSLFVFDANLQKLVTYDIRGILSGKPSWTETSITGIAPNMVLQALPVGNGKLLLCGNNDMMRFGLWNTRTSAIESVVRTYPSYSKDPETNWAVSGYSASVRYSEAQNKLVACTYVGAAMEVYDMSRSDIGQVSAEYYYAPVYKYVEGTVPRWIVPAEDTVIGFEDLCLTDTGVYGLVWGVESSAMEKSIPTVIKFDYDGFPQCRYILPDILMAFTVDENGDIYGMALNENMEFNIKKYY